MQPGDTNENVPEHIRAMNSWSPVPDGYNPVDNQPSRSVPPPVPMPSQRPRAGLLSSWNAGKGQNLQPQQQPGVQNLDSIVNQDTLEQRTVQPPPTQQAWPVGHAANRVDPQAFMNGPVSPRDSGIAAFPALYGNAPVQQPAAPRVYPPDPQMFGQNMSAPPMPMPGYAQAPVQQMGYAGAGGPPPYMPPVAPGNGGRGSGREQRMKRRFPIWARVVVAFVLLIMLAGGGFYTYYQVNFSKPISDITGQTVNRAKGEENPNQGRNGDILSGPRINILLLGSDTDQKFGTSAGGATVYLAQTDIIVTIDPATKTVGMLSIPRDFYINIPGYGMGKLDEAFEHGYSIGQGGFAGAVDLSRRTIEQDFGIPINYYAWVGLDGFVKVINTVGGVDVDVTHPITDDSYPFDVGNNTNDIYAYQRLYITPGPQHLSGPEALEYVRSRHADLVGDFGRSARQQQVLSALKIKLANPSIVGELPQLAQDLDGYVKTDMQLTDVLKMMNFARTIDMNKINRVILQPPYSSAATLPSGESIVNPNCSQIVPVIAQMFDIGSSAACNITANSNNSMLASAHQPSSAQQQVASTPTSQPASTSTSNASQQSSSDNMAGLHGLLDLLFATVFESPQAMQV